MAMNHVTERAERALRQWVTGGRTFVDVGEELTCLRRERGLSPTALAQRATLPVESVLAVESGTRLPTNEEFDRLAIGLEMAPGRLAEILKPVLSHQASGIGSFRGCYQPERRQPGGGHPDP